MLRLERGKGLGMTSPVPPGTAGIVAVGFLIVIGGDGDRDCCGESSVGDGDGDGDDGDGDGEAGLGEWDLSICRFLNFFSSSFPALLVIYGISDAVEEFDLRLEESSSSFSSSTLMIWDGRVMEDFAFLKTGIKNKKIVLIAIGYSTKHNRTIISD